MVWSALVTHLKRISFKPVCYIFFVNDGHIENSRYFRTASSLKENVAEYIDRYYHKIHIITAYPPYDQRDL